MSKQPEFLKFLVQNAKTGEEVPFGSVLQGRTVVTLLRRFGCLLCREGAAELTKHKAAFDKENVSIVALAHEKLGYEEFVEGKYFDGPIYYDEKKNIYKALGTTRASAFSLLRPTVIAALRRASASGHSGNVKGDGWQLGGTYVLEKDGSIVYSRPQTHFGDHAPIEEVLAAARLPSKQVKDALDNAPEVAETPLSDQEVAEAKKADEDAEGFVKSLIASKPVVVFSKTWCPYSKHVKQTLTEHGATFEAIELDKREDGPVIQSALQRLTNRSTVPNVFVNGKTIGGDDDVSKLAQTDELRTLLSTVQ